MGKVLVLYYNKDGSTEKMAALIAEGASKISDTEIRIKHVKDTDKEDVIWFDGLALG